MTNTEEITFPAATVTYVPDWELFGMIRLTADELADVVRAFNRARACGADFALSQDEYDEDYVDLFFEVAQGSVQQVAREVGPVVTEINAAG